MYHDRERYRNWQTNQLRDELARRNLSRMGTRKDLANKLLEDDQSRKRKSLSRSIDSPSRSHAIAAVAAASSFGKLRQSIPDAPIAIPDTPTASSPPPRLPQQIPGNFLDAPLASRSPRRVSQQPKSFLDAPFADSPRRRPQQPVLVGKPTISIGGVARTIQTSPAISSSSHRPDMLPGVVASQQRTTQTVERKFRVSALLARARAPRLGRPSMLSIGARKRRQASQQVETVDLLDNSDEEIGNNIGFSESQLTSGPKQVLSSARIKKLRRRSAGDSQVPPPSASLSLRARQLRMLLCGGVCEDLQTTYLDLLASFRGKALQMLHVEDARGEPVAEGVEEVTRDEVAAAAAVKRARRSLEVATHRSLVASARLRRLVHSETSATQAVARCDEDLLATEKELTAIISRRDQLRQTCQFEAQRLGQEYQAEIQSIQQQLEQNCSVEDGISNTSTNICEEKLHSPEKTFGILLPSCLAGWCQGGASSCIVENEVALEEDARHQNQDSADP